MGEINSGKKHLKSYKKDIVLLKYLLYNNAKPSGWLDEWLYKKGYKKEELEIIKNKIYKTQGFYLVEDENIVYLGDDFVVSRKV